MDDLEFDYNRAGIAESYVITVNQAEQDSIP
jgi:hypothetical protein